MADTFTSLLRFILQTDMENINRWGTTFNSAFAELADEAIAGSVDIDVTLGDVTVAPSNGLSDRQRPMHLRIVGSPGTTRTITFPTTSKLYIIGNATNPATNIILTTLSGTSITLTAAQTPTMIFVDAVQNEVRIMGRSDAAIAGIAWTAFGITITSATLGDTAFNCFYSKQGKIASIIIPAHNVTVSAATWVIFFDDGNLPPAIQHAGVNIAYPMTVTINSGGTVIPSFLTVEPGAAVSMRFRSADPDDSPTEDQVYGGGVDRDLAQDLLLMYSVN